MRTISKNKWLQVIEKIKSGWTQGGVPARNKDGLCVNELSPDAVCWCLEGACVAVCGTDFNMSERMIGFIANTLGLPPHYVGCWNDDKMRRKEDIICLLENIVRRYYA